MNSYVVRQSINKLNEENTFIFGSNGSVVGHSWGSSTAVAIWVTHQLENWT